MTREAPAEMLITEKGNPMKGTPGQEQQGQEKVRPEAEAATWRSILKGVAVLIVVPLIVFAGVALLGLWIVFTLVNAR